MRATCTRAQSRAWRPLDAPLLSYAVPAHSQAFRQYAALTAGSNDLYVGVVQNLGETKTITDDSFVKFGDLLQWIDRQYGLASKFIKEPMSEILSILGYRTLTTDTIIEHRDASIVVEDLGVPALTPDQIQEMKFQVVAAPGEVGDKRKSKETQLKAYDAVVDEMEDEIPSLLKEPIVKQADRADNVEVCWKTKLNRRGRGR